MSSYMVKTTKEKLSEQVNGHLHDVLQLSVAAKINAAAEKKLKEGKDAEAEKLMANMDKLFAVLFGQM